MNTVRLKDIADKTGFSISTVSRILSGDTNRKMKEETISLVLQTADAMGYYKTKNQKLRKALPTVRMLAIFQEESEASNTLTLGILDGIRKEVIELSPHMRLEYDTISTNDSNFRDRLSRAKVDAAVIVGRIDEETIEFISSHIGYILYSGLDGLSGHDEIICDAREGIRKGVSFLSLKGRKRIAYIGPSERNGYPYLGYLEGLADSHIERDQNLVENADSNTLNGYEAAMHLLGRTTPDAIVTASDSIALGVMRAMKEMGIRCPETTALIGFGNQESSAYLDPSLSSFEVPKKELGQFAVRIAIDRIENPRKGCIRVTLPYTFIERESTGKNI